MTTAEATIDRDEVDRDEHVEEPPRADTEPETEPRSVTVIKPRSGWRFIDFGELYDYRDLFRFLVWRHVKVRYAQSALGIGWAVIQPLFSMFIFTVVFGLLAGVDSDGAPYAVFSLVAMVPWTYFSNSVTESAQSLLGNTNMLTKVYFPRLVLPLSSVVAKLVDFGIAMVLVAVTLAIYGIVPGLGVLVLPLLVVLMMLTAAGIGTWLTALAIQYRDVKHGLSFAIQLLMYASPVVYPASLVPTRFEWQGFVINPQLVYALNPMVGVIEGFRAALLGTRAMPWAFIGIGTVVALVVAVTGCLYFRSRERLFADVA